MSIEARLTLRSEAVPAIGRERIALLEAVARNGSISAGAREIGITYKAAWDALDAMANLFGTPLLLARAGGKAGGGAALTEAGLRVVQAFHRIEGELERLMRTVEPDLAGTGISPLNLFSGLLMKTSARNALRGTVTAIAEDRINAEIAVRVSGETVIHALITVQSVRDLGLIVGRKAIVLVKAPFVMIAPGAEPPLMSVRNCVPGTVRRCERGEVSAEIVLDIGGGKSLAATISAASAQSLGLEPGQKACALFDSAHVILAVD